MVAGFMQFIDGSLVEVDEKTAGVQLAVADSWLVEDSRVRSLNLHFERFATSVIELAPRYQALLPYFFAAVEKRIAMSGRWWPRIEFHGDAEAPNQLFLSVREAPEQLGEAVLWTYSQTDPRSKPLTKGPDLSLGMQLRRHAAMNGADEAVLLNEDGYINECALSALVWWRGDVLCAPNSETPWLDSVTRREVFAIAEQMGLNTRLEKVKPADLVELEVWMLSSLQGIRPVNSWINLGGPVAQAKHLEAFQKRLRMLATAID